MSWYFGFFHPDWTQVWWCSNTMLWWWFLVLVHSLGKVCRPVARFLFIIVIYAKRWLHLVVGLPILWRARSSLLVEFCHIWVINDSGVLQVKFDSIQNLYLWENVTDLCTVNLNTKAYRSNYKIKQLETKLANSNFLPSICNWVSFQR